MSDVITEFGSVLEHNPREAVALYRCSGHTYEDPERVVLDRHLLGLTINKAYRACIRHNSDKYEDLFYQPNEIFLWSSGSHHHAAWQNCDALLLSLDAAFFSTTASKALDQDIAQLTSQFRARDPLVALILKELIEVASRSCGNSNLYFESLSITLAVRLGTLWGSGKLRLVEAKCVLSPRIRQLITEAIAENLDRSLTVTGLSELAGMSTAHFIRAFRSTIGLSPYQYILSKRLELAMHLCKYSNEPLSHVALRCGFSSQSHMGSQFKRRFKTTPKKVRGG
ncbi:MAG: AraC family transcriptional regulator [Pseudomonadota bacterium]